MNTGIAAQERILVLTSNSTGNNVFCTPAIRLLRKHRPHALIGVVALNDLSAEIFEDNPDINHLYVTSTKQKFEQVADQYTYLICLNNNAVKKLKGIARPHQLAPDFVNGSARADQLLDYVAELLGVQVREEDRHYVMGPPKPGNILEGYGVAPGEVLIHIHLGLGRTALHGWKFFYRKRAGEDVRLWPLAHYIELGRLLQKNIPGCRLVVTGTSNEAYLAKQFSEAVPSTINLVGKTSAMDIYGMMRRINLFIAHDCGVLHIASASDVPIVGIYAPTEPVLAGPYPPRPQH
ncbi:MAG TPA: glycosyltransferase family 9 protein, partial [Methylophilaceae bacterium]|nr:glycosyltransferase family 9 protein [Methylophilaceae bacterium]